MLSINNGLFDLAILIFNRIIKPTLATLLVPMTTNHHQQQKKQSGSSTSTSASSVTMMKRDQINELLFVALDDNMKERIRTKPSTNNNDNNKKQRQARQLVDVVYNDSLTSILLYTLNIAIWSSHISMISFIELLMNSGAYISNYNNNKVGHNASAPWYVSFFMFHQMCVAC
jgi:hypothetical protein